MRTSALNRRPNGKLWIPIAVLLLFAACEDDFTPDGPFTGWNFRHEGVRVETSMGDFEIELYDDEAPITVENFKRYVTDGFYDGLIFHRVIDNFMCQGGQFDAGMVQKAATYPPIHNEAGNGLSNLHGTIAMVRTSDPQSAQCQFFINVKDNVFLDHHDDTVQGYGYAVFGRIRSGMDVVEAINDVPTGPQNGFNDVPVTPIHILKMSYIARFK